ncbi:MAG: RodZ domain-containing protein [Nitrospirota bacterium]
MGTLGAYLSSAREAMGLELHDAAQQTRISIHYLSALEREDFSKLPGEVFVKGFLKNYARFLNLPESEALKKYGELRTTAPVAAPAGAVSPEPVAPVCEPKKREETPLEPVIWGAVIFIALLIFLFTAAPKKQLPTSEPQTAAAPAGAQPAAVSVPAGKPEKLYLEIIALEDVWLLVRTDSSPQKKAVLKKGENVTWSADERFLLSYGSVGAARLVLNGGELTVNGPKSAVVRDLTITAAGIASQRLQEQQAPVPKPRPQQPAPAPAPQPAQETAPPATPPPPAAPESGTSPL